MSMSERPVLKLKSHRTDPVPTPVVTEISVAPVVTKSPVSQAPPLPPVSNAPQLPPVSQERKSKKRIVFSGEVHAFMDLFCQNHPDHFPLCGPQIKNWAMGIRDEIIAKYSDVDPSVCRNALKLWLSRSHIKHTRALSEGGDRYTLAGDVAGQVTQEQQETARIALQQVLEKLRMPHLGLRQIGKKVKPARPKPSPAHVPSPLPSSKQGEQTMPTIEVRAFKVTIAMDAALLPTDCIAPDGQPTPPIPMIFQCGDIALTATFPGKNYKKAMKGVVSGAFAVIQGKLGSDNTLSECGLTIQPPKVVDG